MTYVTSKKYERSDIPADKIKADYFFAGSIAFAAAGVLVIWFTNVFVQIKLGAPERELALIDMNNKAFKLQNRMNELNRQGQL
jgi:hypothetical protein